MRRSAMRLCLGEKLGDSPKLMLPLLPILSTPILTLGCWLLPSKFMPATSSSRHGMWATGLVICKLHMLFESLASFYPMFSVQASNSLVGPGLEFQV